MARAVQVIEIFDGREWIPVRTDNGRLICCLFPEDAGRAAMEVIQLYAARGTVVHPKAIRAQDYVQTAVAAMPVNTSSFGSAGSVGSL